nr:14965_t:CDS:2 [Entrophospora candida]
MGRIHKEYYSANATYLSDEAIKEIKRLLGKVSDAINTMAKKYRISHTRAQEYIENHERKQQMIYPRATQIRSIISPEIVSMLENNTTDIQKKKRKSKSKFDHNSDLPQPPVDKDPETEKLGRNQKEIEKIRASGRILASKLSVP